MSGAWSLPSPPNRTTNSTNSVPAESKRYFTACFERRVRHRCTCFGAPIWSCSDRAENCATITLHPTALPTLPHCRYRESRLNERRRRNNRGEEEENGRAPRAVFLIAELRHSCSALVRKSCRIRLGNIEPDPANPLSPVGDERHHEMSGSQTYTS